MIIQKDGQYFLRDLGVVHTTRIKADEKSEIQIQQGSLVDLGKVVHYHFDKVTHHVNPSVHPSNSFMIMRPQSSEYNIDEDDLPVLRARPTWISSDESEENILKEIYMNEDKKKEVFSVGRSGKRDVCIKLKAVSADHCGIGFSSEKGWYISEKGKSKLSSNGTFVFMKSMQQMSDHEPSDMIPLYDGMVISFINYELHVKLSQKSADQIANEEELLQKMEQSLPAPNIDINQPTSDSNQVAQISEQQQQDNQTEGQTEQTHQVVADNQDHKEEVIQSQTEMTKLN
jgi:hypothetical protein